MATEIELKYLVENDQLVEKITNFLQQHQYTYVFQENVLNNFYFDTKALELRQHDCGLRVRSKNGKREQTIKLAGQVVGGLHKRPEYNVDIDDNVPNLSLFPNDIWPTDILLEQWQQGLIVLFSTDFTRCAWLIDFNESQIELVFDLGKIISGGTSTDICEIELELVTGKVDDLFALAELLMAELVMRSGTLSKAARGYQLYHQTQINYQFDKFPSVVLQSDETLQVCFDRGISFSLGQLQQAINAYFSAPSLDLLIQINQSLILLRHGFWLFKENMTEQHELIRKELSYFIRLFSWVNNAFNLQELLTRGNSYRKKIEYSEQLVEQLKLEKRRIPEPEQVCQLLTETRFNRLQLALLKLVVNQQSLQNLPNFSLKEFSKQALTSSLNELNGVMSSDDELSCEQYLEQKSLLNRNLHTGGWLSAIYDQNLRADYRAPWLDMMSGITELETLWFLRQQLERLAEQPEKLVNWLDSKIDNLLVALNASRQMALKTTPYWLV